MKKSPVGCASSAEPKALRSVVLRIKSKDVFPAARDGGEALKMGHAPALERSEVSPKGGLKKEPSLKVCDSV